jgi:monofunctional glycosyltransferase
MGILDILIIFAALIVALLMLRHTATIYRIFEMRSVNPRTSALMWIRYKEAGLSCGAGWGIDAWIPYDVIPRNIVISVLVAEDMRYFSHHGFDWANMYQALKLNLRNLRVVSGGSTISQQAAKNLFLYTARTVRRKIIEAVITIELELILGKKRILEIYMNTIEFGHLVFGIEAAAKHYFQVSVGSLTDHQAAFLGVIIRSPREGYTIQSLPALLQQSYLEIYMKTNKFASILSSSEAHALKSPYLRKAAEMLPPLNFNPNYRTEI